MIETDSSPDSRKSIIAQIQGAEALTDIGISLASMQRRLGFSYYKLFVARPSVSDKLRDHLLLYNFPEDFFGRFDAVGIRVPTPEELFRSGENRTFTWKIETVEQVYKEPERSRLLQVLDDYRLRTGVYFSLHAIEGPNRVLAFYGERPQLTPAELEDFSMLSFQLLHRVYMLEKRGGEWSTGVSAMDMSCLSLAAAGLDSSAIAQRMGFSARTVNYLVSSVCQKLGVDTLEHAVTEALRRGFIT